MKRLITLLITGGLLVAGHAHADAAAGKAKSSTCAACHGADGNSVAPNFPNLAGQHEDYLYHALKAYKSGKRKNAVMAGQVASLSDQDMQDLAAYFASQSGGVYNIDALHGGPALPQ